MLPLLASSSARPAAALRDGRQIRTGGTVIQARFEDVFPRGGSRLADQDVLHLGFSRNILFAMPLASMVDIKLAELRCMGRSRSRTVELFISKGAVLPVRGQTMEVHILISNPLHGKSGVVLVRRATT